MLATATAAADGPISCTGLDAGLMRTVTRVIDGETVGLDDGTELRLIGALAPRAIDVGAEAGLWPMEITVREEVRALLLGKSIELAFGGDRLDRYGRLQAQAFWLEGEQRRWVQGHLLERGLARAYTLAGNRACANELLAAERIAREGHLGLWAEAAYQIRQAHQPSELLRYRTTFQVVEGHVVRVAQVRGVIYLNFDRNWRQAFAVSLRRDDSHHLGDYAGNPKGLEGRSVRARGWIEHRSGPLIDLSSAGQIEVIADAEAKAARAR